MLEDESLRDIKCTVHNLNSLVAAAAADDDDDYDDDGDNDDDDSDNDNNDDDNNTNNNSYDNDNNNNTYRYLRKNISKKCNHLDDLQYQISFKKVEDIYYCCHSSLQLKTSLLLSCLFHHGIFLWNKMLTSQ